MSTNTPRLGLYMPADDGSEPVDVATDLNDNLEKLDNSVGFVPSTSSTPPSSPFDGMATYETDTGRAKFRASSTWKNLLAAGASFVSDILMSAGYKIGIGTLTPAAYLDVSRAPGTVTNDTVVRVKNSDQAHARLSLSMDSLQLGDGSAAPDVGFFRAAYGQIDIVGAVNMPSLAVSGTLAANTLDVSADLDIGGSITSDATILGKLSGTGFNVPNIVRKTSDTTRTSTTTVADDPQLTFTAEANSTYFIQTWLIYSGSNAGDFKYSWTVPAGTSGIRWSLGESVGATDYASTTMRTSAHQPGTDVAFGCHTTGLFNGALDTAVFTTSSTAGPITLRFAQNSSSTDATTLRSGTVMTYTKVE